MCKHYRTWELNCVKSVQIRSYFWFVFSCISTEYRKVRTRNNSVFGHFSRSAPVEECFSEEYFSIIKQVTDGEGGSGKENTIQRY